MAYIGAQPIPGIAGGTGHANTGLTIDLLTGAASGKVMMSDSSGNGTWQVGGSGLTTIAGDSGTPTLGPTVTFNAVSQAGKTVSFSVSGTTVSLNTTDGNTNTAIGYGAGAAISSFASQTYIGSLAGTAADGAENTFVGNNAGLQLTTGGYNTGIGSGAAYNLGTTSSYNVALGYATLCNGFLTPTVMHYCIAIGRNAGLAYVGTDGSTSNILLANNGVAGESNTIHIGTQGTGDGQQNVCYIAGIHGATITGSAVLISSTGQLGDISSSRTVKENIEDIGDHSILSLRPVRFNYISDKTKTPCYGLIAEEVEELFPDLVLYKNEKPYSIKYHEMPAILLNEIQKLRKEVDLLKARAT